MRCPNCGGFTDHFLTTTRGEVLRICYTPRTSAISKTVSNQPVVLPNRVEPCQTILNSLGQPYTGVATFHSSDKLQDLKITSGKLERR